MKQAVCIISALALNFFLVGGVPVKKEESDDRTKRADIYGGPYYQGAGGLHSGLSNGYGLGGGLSGGHGYGNGIGLGGGGHGLGLGNGIYGGGHSYQIGHPAFGGGSLSHATGYGGGYGSVGIAQSGSHIAAHKIPHYRSSEFDLGDEDMMRMLTIEDARAAYGPYGGDLSLGHIGGGFGPISEGHIGGGYGHVDGGHLGDGFGHLGGGHLGVGYGQVGGGHIGSGYGHVAGGYGHGSAVGVFSHAPSGYAVPLLLSCKPSLVQGSLHGTSGYGSAHHGYDGHASISSPHAYREVDMETNDGSAKADNRTAQLAEKSTQPDSVAKDLKTSNEMKA